MDNPECHHRRYKSINRTCFHEHHSPPPPSSKSELHWSNYPKNITQFFQKKRDANTISYLTKKSFSFSISPRTYYSNLSYVNQSSPAKPLPKNPSQTHPYSADSHCSKWFEASLGRSRRSPSSSWSALSRRKSGRNVSCWAHRSRGVNRVFLWKRCRPFQLEKSVCIRSLTILYRWRLISVISPSEVEQWVVPSLIQTIFGYTEQWLSLKKWGCLQEIPIVIH